MLLLNSMCRYLLRGSFTVPSVRLSHISPAPNLLFKYNCCESEELEVQNEKTPDLRGGRSGEDLL